jgi:DNA-binding ferritin-like protein (Dps family)
VRKINKLGRRAAALVLAVGLTLSTAAPVLAADADEVQTPAAQTQQQETDTEADEADVDTETDEAAALPELSEDRAVAEEDEAAALPELSEDREVAEEDEAAALPELSEDREAAGADAELYAWKPHSGPCERSVLLETQAATCTTPERKKWKCTKNFHFNNWWEDTAPALGHNMSDWIVVKATCTTAGEKYKACQRSGCNYKVVEEGYAEAHPALGHDFEGAEWIIEPATCTTPGKRYQVCQHEGCTEEKVDPTYAEEHPALNHVWGKYVDDDKPGCEQQTGTAHCTREGCTATDQKDLPNFGPDGNPLPHKYTTYEYVKNNPLKCKSTCDYGCGTTKEFGSFDKDVVVDKTTQGAMDTVKLDGKTADAYVDAVIDKALANAQEAVKNAKTKEEALAALDQISSTVKSELSSVRITVAGVGGDVTISEKDLNKALAPLDSTVADLKSSLNDSFLSQDTITNMVDKLAGDVQDSSAPQAGIKQILHNTVYDVIYNLGVSDDKKKTTDNTQAISDMVLQLVKEVVQSDKGWNDLTGSLVDDAVDLAVDELMKDKTYAKLLKTKLGAATMEEVRAEVRKQLVEDPEFMNQVRGIASKAVDNAQKGVNAGWSNEKIMNRLQADLLPDVTDLISNQVNKLGVSAGDIVDNKVSDTVHKFLPGKLGDWVSDKIGGKVNDAVTGKVDDLNKQVTDLISTTIKQLTCTHQYESFTVASTCTQKGKTGEICKKCGKTRNTKDIEELAPHTPVVDAAVAPTETTDGLTEGSHCSVCGAVLTAQEVIPMRDPTIDTWFSRAATTEADAKAAGFDSVDAANAALDAALTAAGFDPANAEHFTVQVNSSIGVLPNDRFSESGVTGKLTLPEGTRGKTAQTYYAVQMFTADTRFHKAGDVVVTPVSIDTYAKTGLELTVYSEAVMAIAWKAQ